MDECFIKTKNILTDNKASLDAIAAVLIEKEVIDASEMDTLMKGMEPAAAGEKGGC